MKKTSVSNKFDKGVTEQTYRTYQGAEFERNWGRGGRSCCRTASPNVPIGSRVGFEGERTQVVSGGCLRRRTNKIL